MKISHMLAAAGLVIAAMGASAPAAAQPHHPGGPGGHFDRHDRGHHVGPDRDWRRHGYRNDRDWRRHGYRRGYAYGYGSHGRDRCWSEWRRNHRVRVCR